MELYKIENIKVNQFLDVIHSSAINLIRYEDDKIIDSGSSSYLEQKYKNCDFDILDIEQNNNRIDITVQTNY